MSWTPERRKKQSEAIHRWKPWNKSTGARTEAGKAISARNAFKGGQRAEMRAIACELRLLMKHLKGLST